MDSVNTRVRDEILVVTINRPQARNAVDWPTAKALANEFRHGMASIEQAASGAGRFVSGAGRSGDFSEFES